MAAWNTNVKTAFLKGLEKVGQRASSLASNAHQKLDELNMETRRRELLHETTVRAMELWENGVKLPEELDAVLSELHDLDQQLTLLRAQRYAKVEQPDQPAREADDATAEDAAAPNETAAQETEPAETPEAPMDGGETGDNA